MDLDVLKVKFTHSNTVRDKRPYTIYEIEVRSSSTITWVIYKRYSHFHALHELLKAQSTDPELKDVRLPILPPKRLTRSLAVDFVERRKNELQEYLRAILDQPVLVHSPMMLDFLEVPDSVRPMLTSEGRDSSGRTLYPGLDLTNGDPKVLAEARAGAGAAYSHKSFEERRILELINLLKYHPNKVAAVKSFEEYFFESKPRFTHEFIRLLLQGKSGSDGEGGLVQTCGDFAYSHVACRAALYLLCRLLDVEKNKDAQLFLDQFTSLDVSVLKKMQLHLHILSERGNRLGAFRIVSILRNHYGQAGGNMMQGEATVELIVADTWARKEYFRWAERSGTEQAGTMTYGHEPTPLLGPLSLSEMGYRPVAQQTFADVLRTAQDESGWRIVGSIPATSGNGKQIAPPAVSINDEVSIAYKKDVFKDMVIVRVSAIFPYRPEQLIKILSDLRVRSQWDLKFHKGKLLQQLDKDSDVVQLVFKSFSSPYKYRDFILLRSQSRLDNGGYLLTARSVVHASGVDNKDHVRAVSFPTGYILTPLQGQISDLRAPDKAPTSAELTPGLATAPSSTAGAGGGIGAGARGATAAASVAGSSSSVVSRFQSPSIAVASTAAAGVGSAASSALHFTVRKTVVGNSPFGGGAAASTPGKPPMPGAPSPPPPPATPPPPPSTSPNSAGVGTTTDACMLTFIAQLDREGILILSPDLLGESTELRDSINLIKSQLMKELGPRSLRPSIHTASITAANKMVNNNSLASGMGSGMKFAVSGGDEEDFQTPRSTLSLGGIGTTDGLGTYSMATPRA